MGARDILGIGMRAFRRLAGTELWAGVAPLMPGRHALRFAKADVLALKEKLNRLVPPSVLDTHLGIGRGKGGLLCDAGLLPVHPWNRHRKWGETRSVDLADADALFGRVSALARPGCPDRPVSFTGVLNRAAARRVVSFAAVIRCILSGELRGHVTEPWKPGLASLSFEEADVVHFMDEMASPARSGKMCMGDVVRRLGVPAGAVRELVRAGLLPEPDRNGGLVFDADAVGEFAESYVFDTELAAGRGSTAEEVRAAFALVGVLPLAVVGLRAKGSTMGVFRRSQTSLFGVGMYPPSKEAKVH